MAECANCVQLQAELEAERHDLSLAVKLVGEVYDEVTFGMFSKLLTEPSAVIERVEELRDRDEKAAVARALAVAMDSFGLQGEDIDAARGTQQSEAPDDPAP